MDFDVERVDLVGVWQGPTRRSPWQLLEGSDFHLSLGEERPGTLDNISPHAALADQACSECLSVDDESRPDLMLV